MVLLRAPPPSHHPPRLMAPKFKKQKLFSRQILYKKDFVEVVPEYYFNIAALILLNSE